MRNPTGVRAVAIALFFMAVCCVGVARADDVRDAADAAAKRLAETRRKQAEQFLAWLLEQKDLEGSESSITVVYDMVFEEDHAREVVAMARVLQPGPSRNLIWHAAAYTKSRAGDAFLTGKLNDGTSDEKCLAAECLAAVALRKMGVQCDLSGEGWVIRAFFQGRKEPYTAADVAHLRKLPKLSSLSIGNLADDAIDALDGIDTLEFVSVRVETPAIDKALASLRASKHLEVLNIYGPVSDEGLAHVADMVEMQCLRASGPKVTDAGAAHLKHLNSLTILDLENTQVTDAGVAQLAGLTALKDLNLSGTRITDDALVHLRDMKNLYALKLDRTAITDRGIEQFREFDGLKGVQFLYIESTKVTDAGMAHLKDMKNLKGLHADGIGLSDKALEHLAGHGSLAWINAKGGTISEAAALRFARGQSASFYLTYGSSRSPAYAHGGPPKIDEELGDLFRPLKRTDEDGRIDPKELDRLAEQGPNLIEPLLEAVKKNLVDYQNAARVLVRMGPEVRPRLLEVLRKDDHYMTRQTVGWAFREMGDAVIPLMVELLDDKSPRVRHMAADALYNFTHRAGTKLPDGLEARLIASLKDTESEVRRSAAGMLSRFDHTSGQVVPALLNALGSDKDLNVRIYCVASLGQIGAKLDQGADDQQRILKAITASCLNDESFYVRDVSVYYLGQLAKKDKAAVIPIVKATGDEDRNVRAKAEQVLNELGVSYR